MPVPAGRGGPQRIPRPPASAVGEPAPWAHLPEAERRITLTGIREAFAGRAGVSSRVEGNPGVSASAVLAPFYEEDGDVHVLLTRRSRNLRSHTGEVSFPGGRADEGESPERAAVREAEEEIALDPASVEIVGELDHLMTVSSQSFIVPYIAILPGRPERLTLNPAEVDAVLYVPLTELLLDEVYREERWQWPERWGESLHSIFFFELVGDTVWGATAAMLRQFLALALGVQAGIEHV